MTRIRLAAFILLCTFLSVVLPTVAQDALPLTQHYTSSDEKIVFSYPADWQIKSLDDASTSLDVSVGTPETALDKDPVNHPDDVLAAGEVRVNILSIPKQAIAQVIGLTSDASIADVLKGLVKNASLASLDFGAISKTTVNGFPAAQISFTSVGHSDGLLLLIDFGSGLIGGLGLYAAPGEINQWQATALNIAASIVYADAVEPTPEATSEGTSNGVPDLTQTYSSPDGTLNFQYPSDWKLGNVSSSNGVTFAFIGSSESAAGKALDNPSSTFDSGDVAMELFVATPAAIAQNIPGLEVTDDPVKFLQSLIMQGSSKSSYTFGDLQATNVNDFQASRSAIDAGDRGQGFVMIVRLGDGLIAGVTVETAKGELAQAEATAQAIIATVSAQAAVETTPESPASPALDLPETFTNTAGNISVNYPSGWVTEAFSESVTLLNVSMATSQAAEQKNFGTSDIFAPGEARMQVQVLNEEQLLQTPNVKAGDTPVQMLDALFQTTGTLPAGMTVSKASAVSINDQAGAVVQVKNAEKGDGIIWLVHLNTGLYVVATAATASGEQPKWNATFQAILESITVSDNVVPEATPEGIQSATLDLAETYTTENGAGSLNYPSDWVTEAIHTTPSYMDVRMSNTSEALDKGYLLTDSAFAPGEVQIEIAFLDADQIFKTATGVTAESTPAEILDAAFQTTGTLPAGTTITKASAITLNNKPAAEMQITAAKGDEVVLLFPYRLGIYALMIFTTASGELSNWEATAQAILASAQLSDNAPLSTAEPLPTFAPLPSVTPAPTEMTEGTSSNQKVTVNYPADWVARVFASSGIYLANNDSALSHTLGTAFAPGEVQIFVIADTIANLTPQLNLGLKADADAMSLLQASLKVLGSLVTTDTLEATTVNGLPAAELIGHGSDFDVHSVVIELGNNVLGVVQVLSAPGEMVQWQDITQRVLESVAYKS